MLQKPEEPWCSEVAPHLRGHIWFECVSAYENKLQLHSLKEGISMLTAAKTIQRWLKVFWVESNVLLFVQPSPSPTP